MPTLRIEVGGSPTVEKFLVWIQTQSINTNAQLTRIEATLDDMQTKEGKLMAAIDDLKAAVLDNIAAQKEGFDAVAAEDANIEKAIAALTAAASNDPAIADAVAAIKGATDAQRAANSAVMAENEKLAAALAPPAA